MSEMKDILKAAYSDVKSILAHLDEEEDKLREIASNIDCEYFKMTNDLGYVYIGDVYRVFFSARKRIGHVTDDIAILEHGSVMQRIKN